MVDKVVRPYQREEDEGTRPDYIEHNRALASKKITPKKRSDFDDKIKELRDNEGT